MEGNDARRTRTQDVLQSILILVLLVALLFVGSVTVTYMVKSSHNEARYELVKQENKMLLDQLETRMNSSVDRKVSSLEDRTYTLEERVRFIERNYQKKE